MENATGGRKDRGYGWRGVTSLWRGWFSVQPEAETRACAGKVGTGESKGIDWVLLQLLRANDKEKGSRSGEMKIYWNPSVRRTLLCLFYASTGYCSPAETPYVRFFAPKSIPRHLPSSYLPCKPRRSSEESGCKRGYVLNRSVLF